MALAHYPKWFLFVSMFFVCFVCFVCFERSFPPFRLHGHCSNHHQVEWLKFRMCINFRTNSNASTVDGQRIHWHHGLANRSHRIMISRWQNKLRDETTKSSRYFPVDSSSQFPTRQSSPMQEITATVCRYNVSRRITLHASWTNIFFLFFVFFFSSFFFVRNKIE